MPVQHVVQMFFSFLFPLILRAGPQFFLCFRAWRYWFVFPSINWANGSIALGTSCDTS